MNKKKIKENLKKILYVLILIVIFIIIMILDVDSTTSDDMIKEAQQQAIININSKNNK